MEIRTRATAIAGLASIAAVAVACSPGPEGDPVVTTSTSAAAATTTATSPASPTPTTPSPTPTPTELEPLTLAFVGDMNFDGEIGPRLDADPAAVFGDARALLGVADLTFGNLETAIGEGGTPEIKDFVFQAPPSAFTALELAGFDAVSMANNHGVDYGAAGLAQTLAAIDGTDVAVAGLGADAGEAYAPVLLEAKGRTVAFLAALDLEDETYDNWGATDTSPGVARYDARFVESVRQAATTADVTIAYLHWAPENQECPSPDVAPPIVDELVAAGADVIIGAHAHRLQGAGWRDRVFVSYGMGNYLWYFQRNEISTRTGILTVTVDGANDPVSYDYAPARILNPSGIPQPMTGAEAEEAERLFEDLRSKPNPWIAGGPSCTDLAAEPAPAG